MEAQVSEILENILSLMNLEGSFEVVEGPEEINVDIDTEDAGRLIGFKGEALDALQLLVNQILSRQSGDNFKRVVVDVGGWRKNKEGDLERRARSWAQEVVETKKEIELDPMPAWQRRVVHMVVSEIEGVSSESIGEGRERHLVIKLASADKIKKETPKDKKVTKVKKTTKVKKI